MKKIFSKNASELCLLLIIISNSMLFCFNHINQNTFTICNTILISSVFIANAVKQK
jgi:hypothetical protein